MPATVPYYTVGSTKKFRATITKDAVAWNLTSAIVTFVFIKPDGSQLNRSGTVENAVGGIAYYVTLTTDLSVKGAWSVYVKVVDGAIDDASNPVEFLVHDR